MTSSERIEKTFRFEPTDKIPVFHIGLSSKTASALLGREAYIGGGVQQWREACALWNGEAAHEEYLERSMEDAFEISDALNMDIVRAEYWRMPEKPAKKLDRYNFLYGDERNWRIRRYYPETEIYDTVDSYPPPVQVTFGDLEQQLNLREKELAEYDPRQTFRAAERALEKAGGKKAVRINAGHMDIPVEAVWMEAVCLAPELVERHLALQAEKALKDIAYLARMKGSRYIFGGSDIACNTGTLFSPAVFRQLFLPALRRVTEACHNAGLLMFFCSDGRLWPVAEDLFGRSGLDGYCEIDRRAGMDLNQLRERFPGLRLIGNISSATVHLSDALDIEREVISCMDSAKKYGGITVGCSNYFMNETPVQNVIALREAIEKYR